MSLLKYTKITVIGIVLTLGFIRFQNINWESKTAANILSYDAFGYYLYLPGQFIYHDLSTLNWLPAILEKYNSAGSLYQISNLPNGNKVIKYPLGIAVLYAPFFMVGHWIALWTGAPPDGFSAPYQIAICCSALFYALLGLWLLGWVLLQFFSDGVTAFVLLMVALASNYIQYVSADSGMTHGFLFAMYAAMLYATVHWSGQPNIKWAFLIGLILGITTVSRPTEAVMLLIPLLWTFGSGQGNNGRELRRSYPIHLAIAALGFILALCPQLLYWKHATGGWVYDVGSKFQFFKPHWQVLFGWEKGWFVYTPIAVFMVAGLFFMQKRPFQKAIFSYFLINTWIIIAWADWRYGASYSCRALVQSYPVLALALACLVERIWATRWKWLAWPLGIWLIGVNLFQIWQYKHTILHYNDNNRAYYQAIFLNPAPTPLDMSLLDTDERLKSEKNYEAVGQIKLDSSIMINVSKNPRSILIDKSLENPANQEQWLKVQSRVMSAWGAFDSYITLEIRKDSLLKQRRIRLENGLCKPMTWNPIAFYFKIPAEFAGAQLRLSAETKAQEDIYLEKTNIQIFQKKITPE